MKRVLVIGSPGAGKTTLSLALAERTGLPVIHLDKHYWRREWTMPSEEDWRAQVSELVLGSAWIMDGNYTSTYPDRFARADTVIALDFPTWRCLWRALIRAYRRRRASHWRPDRPEDCSEQFDFGFLKIVLGFRRRRRKQMMASLAAFTGTKTVLTSPIQVDRFLDGVRRREDGQGG